MAAFREIKFQDKICNKNKNKYYNKMNEDIIIVPATITTTNIISSISLEIVGLVFNSYVNVRVLQKSSDGNICKVEHIRIEGDDYKNWKDDDYIPNFILNKLGYEKSTKVDNV